MRTECIFCRAALTAETRSPQPCKHTDSGFTESRRSWCRGCDSFDAKQRAARAMSREWWAKHREAQLASKREYNATQRRPQPSRAQTFRCTDCRRVFKRVNAAWRWQDGMRVVLDACRYCAAERVPFRQLTDDERRERERRYKRAYRAKLRTINENVPCA